MTLGMRLGQSIRCFAAVSVIGVLLAISAGTAAPDAWARDSRRGDEAGKGGATGANSRQPPSEDRRREAPEETEDQRRQRQQRVLRGKDRAEIRTVLGELHIEESAEARDLLIEYAKRSRNETLKCEALRALGWRGNRRALDFLRGKHGLTSTRSHVVAAACRAVGSVGDPTTKPLLLARVTSKDAAVAAGALAGLVSLDKRAVDLPALVELAAAHDAVIVRVEAATALAKIKSDEWRPLLMRLVDDPEPLVRAEACRALGKRHDEASVGRLMKLQADDSDAAVRAAAKAALLAIDDSLSDD